MEKGDNDESLTSSFFNQATREQTLPKVKELQQNTSKKNNKTPKIATYILTSIVVLAVGVFGFWFYQNKSTIIPPSLPTITPSPKIKEETPSPDQWKTYSSQVLGFSFVYPSVWSEPTFYNLSTRSQVTFTDGKEVPGGISKLEMTRGVYYNQDLQRELTFKEFVNRRGLASDVEQKDFRLANWQGALFTYHSHGVGYYITEIFLAKSESATGILTIVYRHGVSESRPEEPRSLILNRILSSFRFLNEEQSFEISDWEIFSSPSLDFEVRYPPEFSIEQGMNSLRIFSPPILCTAYDETGTKESIDVNEVNLEFFPHSGESYEEIWNQVFGFEFDDNFDGKKKIDDNEAYYFYQGAEMTFGRQAILVKLSPITALEINVYTPVLVHDCEMPLNQYPGAADKILDTLHFSSG